MKVRQKWVSEDGRQKEKFRKMHEKVKIKKVKNRMKI
jgi:hypothetical protein